MSQCKRPLAVKLETNDPIEAGAEILAILRADLATNVLPALE